MPNVVETVYRFRADRAAIAEVVQENARIDSSLAQVEQTARRLEQAYSQTEHASVRASQARIDALRTEIRLAREQSQIIGDVGRRTTAFARLGAGLGGAAFSGRLMLAGDILDATEAAALFRKELPALATQLGIGRRELVALGAAGVALAGELMIIRSLFNELSESSKRVRELVAGQIDAYKRYSEFVVNATSEQLKAEIEATMKRDLADRQYYENLIALQARVQAALDQGRGLNLEGLAEGAIQLYEALGGNATGLKDINAALEQQRAQLESNRLYLNLLTQAYTDGATAANDAAARQREYTKREIAGLEARMQRELEFQRMLETATSEQVRERLHAIAQERAALQRLAGELEPLAAASSEAADKLRETRDRLAELELQAQGLTERVLPVIEATERWRAALGQVRTSAQTVVETVAQVAQRLRSGAEALARYDAEVAQTRAEAAADLRETERTYQERRLDLVTRFEQDRLERERAYQQQLADLESEYQTRRAEARAEFERDEQRRAEDYYRERKRREEDHRASLLDAAARLDASAVLQEQRQFQKDQKRAEEEYRLETKRRREEFALRERQEAEAFRRRRELAERAYREQERRQYEQYRRQLQQLDAAHRAELERLYSALQRKLQAQQQALQAELAQLLGFQNYEYTVRQVHYDRLRQQLQAFIAATTPSAGAVGGVASGVAGAVGSAITSVIGVLRRFDRGGYTPGGLVVTERGEWVATPQTVRTLERGLGAPLTQQRVQQLASHRYGPITVHQVFGDIGSYSPRQLQQLVERAMIEVFQKLA
jgi:hypothetical protein